MKVVNEKNCVFSVAARQNTGGFSSRKRYRLSLTGVLHKFSAE